MDCIFCKIINKELPSTIYFEDNDVIAFKSIEPVSEIHMLICPKSHIESFISIGSNFSLTPMVNCAQKIIQDKQIFSGYKLVFNGGKYQSIPHLHWHLLAGDLEKNEDIINKT